MFRSNVFLIVFEVLICFSLLAMRCDADVRLESYGDNNWSFNYIFIEGKINVEDVNLLRDLSEKKKIMEYRLDSNGGDVYAAMQIGRYIRSKQGMTRVATNATCYSSCALIYIGGVSRINFGVIGLHRPYLAGASRSQSQIEKIVPNMFAEVRAYVRDMGVTDEFANVMINTPPDTVQTFFADDIERLVPTSDPIYDEVTTSREAQAYGLTTDEYRQRRANQDSACPEPSENATVLDYYEREKCKSAFVWGLSKSVFEARQRATATCSASQDEREAAERLRKSGVDMTDHPVVKRVRECRINIMRGR